MEKLISIRYGKFVKVYRGWFEVRLVDLLVGALFLRLICVLIDCSGLERCLEAAFHGVGGVFMFGEVFGSGFPQSW